MSLAKSLSTTFRETNLLRSVVLITGVGAGNGIKVYLSGQSAPTPVISFNVLHHDAAAAAIITATVR